MSGKVLVTGASGFIGQYLCSELARQSIPFVTAGRNAAVAPKADGYEFDLHNRPLSISAFDDVTCVVHLAGLAHRTARIDAIRSINFEGTIQLAKTAAEAGVEQFIFISSIHAARDSAATLTARNAYAHFKREAEIALFALGEQRPMRINVIRPALVYGAHPKGRLGVLCSMAERGRLPELPEIGAMAMVSRSDIVAGVLNLMNNKQINQSIFTLTDHQQYSLRRIARAFNASQGRVPSVRIPQGFLTALIKGMALAKHLPWLGKRLIAPEVLDGVEFCQHGFAELPDYCPTDTLESVLLHGESTHDR